MARFGLGKRIFLVSAIAVVFCAVAPLWGAQPEADDPLRIVPAESLFCVRINRLDRSLARMDEFLTGVSPFGLSMPVRAGLAHALGSSDPNGVNMAGDFAVFGPLPGGEDLDVSRVGILIPVTEYQRFVADNPNVAEPDAQGISIIGPPEEPQFAAISVGPYALVTTADHRQFLVEMRDWMARGTTSLGQRLAAQERQRARQSPMWAYANIQMVRKIFGPMIQARMEAAREQLRQTPGAGQMDAMAEVHAAVLNTLMQEIQSVSLSVDPDPAVLRTTFVAAAVPDTETARVLSMDSPQQQPNLLGFLRDGAILNFVATPSPAMARAIAVKRADLLAAMSRQTLSKEDIDRMRKLAVESADVFTGPMAMSVVPDFQRRPPMRVRYIAPLKDQQKFRDILDRTFKMMNEPPFQNLLQQLGFRMRFDFEPEAETYENVSIDAVQIAIQPADPNMPEGQAITRMLGERLDLRLATVNNLLLYTLSPEPQQEIRSLIDQARADPPPPVPGEVQAALQLIPDARQAEFFGTYNYARAIQMSLAFLPISLPRVQVPSQSNIALAGDVGDARLLMNMAIPKQHVLEIVKVFAQLQEQQQQPDQQ